MLITWITCSIESEILAANFDAGWTYSEDQDTVVRTRLFLWASSQDLQVTVCPSWQVRLAVGVLPPQNGPAKLLLGETWVLLVQAAPQVSVHSFSRFSLCYYSDSGSGAHSLSSFHQHTSERGSHSSRHPRTLALSTLRGPFVAPDVSPGLLLFF